MDFMASMVNKKNEKIEFESRASKGYHDVTGKDVHTHGHTHTHTITPIQTNSDTQTNTDKPTETVKHSHTHSGTSTFAPHPVYRVTNGWSSVPFSSLDVTTALCVWVCVSLLVCECGSDCGYQCQCLYLFLWESMFVWRCVCMLGCPCLCFRDTKNVCFCDCIGIFVCLCHCECVGVCVNLWLCVFVCVGVCVCLCECVCVFLWPREYKLCPTAINDLNQGFSVFCHAHQTRIKCRKFSVEISYFWWNMKCERRHPLYVTF